MPNQTSTAKTRCIFCRRVAKLTDEHILAYWMKSGEAETRNNSVYTRQSGGPDYEPWSHSRRGPARDMAVKWPCKECNSGWMNEIDERLGILGPQLIKGKPVKLTKNKQIALATWATKLVLMTHLTQPRKNRIMIPESDYTQFYAQRGPGKLMRLWAGCMEPPGKDGGPALLFQEHSLNELLYSEDLLVASGLDPALVSKGYSGTFRFGCCVIGLLKVEHPELLEPHVLQTPRYWVQIWPAIGTKTWPPSMRLTSGRLNPIAVGLRRVVPSLLASKLVAEWAGSCCCPR